MLERVEPVTHLLQAGAHAGEGERRPVGEVPFGRRAVPGEVAQGELGQGLGPPWPAWCRRAFVHERVGVLAVVDSSAADQPVHLGVGQQDHQHLPAAPDTAVAAGQQRGHPPGLQRPGQPGQPPAGHRRHRLPQRLADQAALGLPDNAGSGAPAPRRASPGPAPAAGPRPAAAGNPAAAPAPWGTATARSLQRAWQPGTPPSRAGQAPPHPAAQHPSTGSNEPSAGTGSPPRWDGSQASTAPPRNPPQTLRAARSPGHAKDHP